MTDQSTTPGEELGPDDDPEVMGAVIEVLDLLEAGREVPLEEILARVSEACRAHARLRCEEAIRAGELLLQDASSTSPAAQRADRFGDFLIEEEIGRGGMGVVYRAHQISLDRRVALKLLHPHAGFSPRSIERFRREPMAAGRLQHPGIVRVLSAGEHDGRPWFAMELVEGKALSEIITERRARRKEGSADERGWCRRVAEITAGIAEALDYAHGERIIHRDLKPQNVLLDSSGDPQVVDFGLAKELDLASMSQSGELLGTPYYMSPEQARGKSISIDHRTDIYSLGVVLYEMLTLHRPFEGDTPQQVMHAICFREARAVRKWNPRVPQDLETICIKALEKRAEDRYATAGAMAADLRLFLNHESILARPPGVGRRVTKLARRFRRELVAGTIVALLVGLSLYAYGRVEKSARREVLFRSLDPELIQATASAQVAELLALREGAQELLDIGGATREQQRIARAAMEAVEAEGRLRLNAGRALRASGRADERGRQSDTDYFQSLLLLHQASLFVEVENDLLNIAADYPRITLIADAEDEGAEVLLRRIDPFTGEVGAEERIGSLPMRDQPVAPGYYRIIVSRPGHGFSEMTRLFNRRGRETRLRVWLHPDEVVRKRRNLVELPGGEVSIARYETSNAEYAEFLEALDSEPGFEIEPPWHWQQSNWDADAMARRPVSFITAEQAALFAEWAGARLPTFEEWKLAATPPDGGRFPWGDEVEGIEDWAVLNRGLTLDLETQDAGLATLMQYEGCTVDVDWQPTEPALAHGLCNIIGNVAEWTESLHARPHGELDIVFDKHRISAGFDWRPGRHEYLIQFGIEARDTWPITDSSPQLGVRIAKSTTH